MTLWTLFRRRRLTLRDVVTLLEAISRQLDRIEKGIATMTKTGDQLKADMDALKALVEKLLAAIAGAASGATITQEEADALHAEAQGILAEDPTPGV